MRKIIDKISSDAGSFGSIPFWSWNDRLEPEELRRQIRDMKNLGMKGFFMHARGGLETEYMSDEWFECIDACIDEAKKLGMEAWAYDENGWPSGFGGGALLKDPKNHAVAIEHKNGPFPAEDDDSVISVYEINGDGTFTRVTKDTGKDEYLILTRRRDESYVDTLNPEIADLFLNEIHEKYKARINSDDFGKGKAMPGFFTDEPQYYRWGTTYSDTLPAQFEKTYGYPIYDKLPALFYDFEGADKFRFDYYYLIHKLFINGFIKKIYDWCEENGVCLTGHAVEETTLDSQLMCTGSVMPFYEYETMPGVDYLGRQILDDLSFKQLGSACSQLGKKKRLSEMFACCGWAVTPNELKRVAEVQYASGVNVMCQHLYPYSERGQRKTDYPLHYSDHNPWHGYMKPFDEYFKNLGALLAQGEEYAPVLVIHPIHGAFCKYRKETYSLGEIETKLFEMSRFLGENQIPYHYGDEWMMERMAEVKDGRIRVGKCTYDIIVVPFTYSLDRNTVRLLKEFSESGGKLFLYDGIPPYVDGEPACGKLDFLKSNISKDDLSAARDAVVSLDGKNVRDIRKMSRITEDGKIIYLTNTGTSDLCPVEVTVPGGSWKELDVESLEEKPVYAEPGDPSRILLRFRPGESHVLIESPTSDAGDFAAAPPSVPEKYIPVPDTAVLNSSDDNILTLDMPEYSFNGRDYEKPLYTMGVRDLLLKMRYDGDIWLRYHVNVKDIPHKLRFVTEPVYDSVEVNGVKAEDDGGWWFDRSFKTFDIAGLIKRGENVITVKIHHHQSDYVYYVLYGGVSEALRNCLVFDCEIESSYLVGDFAVECSGSFTDGKRGSVLYSGPFSLVKKPDTVSSEDLVRSGFPFFAGTADIEFEYEYDDGMPVYLKLSDNHAVSEIYVNGEHASTLIWNREADLSRCLKKGKNTIEIKFTCSMRNTLGPHHYVEDELELVGRQMWTFENEWNGRECPVYRERYSFMKFGIK